MRSSKRLPINEEIRAKEIRLIGSSGEQLGIVTLPEALNEAKKSSLDLVQMAKEGDPVVCKLMDHGKHIFDSKKQKSASRKKQKKIQMIMKMNLTPLLLPWNPKLNQRFCKQFFN